MMEAGQSDLTAEWIEKLIVDEGVKNTASNVILVQHSLWNERHTPGHPSKPQLFDDGKNDWEFINDPKNLTYVRIDDGNYPYGSTVKDRDRGDISTPNFKNEDSSFLRAAIDEKNSNSHTRKMWTLAKEIAEVQPWGKFFRAGGVDFSDAVEAMWIFDLSDQSAGLTTDRDFLNHFVIDPPNLVKTDGGKVFNEVNGVVVIEAESTSSALGEWESVGKALKNEYTGEGYLVFDPDGSSPNSPASGKPHSPLTYQFRVNEPGLYLLELRCARETIGKRKDLANDCYVRVEGDYGQGPKPGDQHQDDARLALLQADTKFFGGDDQSFAWAGGTRLDPGGHKNKRRAIYAFKAGETYTLVISGRSEKFKLDRIIFRKTTVTPKTAHQLNLAETLYSAAKSR